MAQDSALCTQDFPSPAPSGVAWISLDDAARRSGKSIGHLRRLCATAWLSAGTARQQRPAGGGKATWQIREDADPTLARVKFPDQIGTDLRPYTQSQRDQALGRKKILDDWESACAKAVAAGVSRSNATKEFLGLIRDLDGRRLSRATLYNWYKAWRRDGLEGLIDGRRGTGVSPVIQDSDPFLAEVQRLWLNENKRSLARCHDLASCRAQEKGWTVRSYKATQRFIAKLPKAVVIKMRLGESAYVDHVEPYISRDYSALASNELWDSDHHECDVFVNVGTLDNPVYRRPWLTAWQDLRSRKIVGHIIRAEDPNTDAIILALDRAVRACGIPARVHVDNGKDFDSYALQGQTKMQRRQLRVQHDGPALGGIFGALNIDCRHVWPYHGQSKPIERFFGTMEGHFGKLWPTYCGPSPESRPEGVFDRIAKGQAPLLEEFVAAFESWLVEYHNRPHEGDGMEGQTPDAVYAARLARLVTAPPELLDVLLLRPTPPVKVTQAGVGYRGLYYGATDPALIPHLGKTVTLRVDDRDLSRVQVYDPSGRFVAIVRANTRIPANATSEDLRTAIADKKRHRKALRDYVDARPRMADDLPDRMTRAAHDRRAKAQANTQQQDQQPTPPSIMPLRSPLEDSLKHLAAAVAQQGDQPLKLAAGAEDVDLRQISGAFARAAAATSDSDESDTFDPFAAISAAVRRSEE